jgi:hypothetical protein
MPVASRAADLAANGATALGSTDGIFSVTGVFATGAQQPAASRGTSSAHTRLQSSAPTGPGTQSSAPTTGTKNHGKIENRWPPFANRTDLTPSKTAEQPQT